MNIISYIPSDDWYFVHDNGRDRILLRVALWAVIEVDSSGSKDRVKKETRVIGMVSIRRTVEPGMPLALEPVPAQEGCYVHKDDLSNTELEILSRYRTGM